jgi:hypothetical protein
MYHHPTQQFKKKKSSVFNQWLRFFEIDTFL